MLSSTLDVEGFVGTLAGPGRTVEATVAGLADVWSASSPDRIRRALASAGVEVDDDDAAEIFLLLEEELAIESERDRSGPRVPLETRSLMSDLLSAVLPDHGALKIADELAAHLPLMALALEVADELGSLAVEVIDSARIGPMGGAALTAAGAGAVILLRDDLSPVHLQCAWLHEFSHVLDPRPWTATSYETREAFACDLADRLLAVNPCSLDEAAPLIGAALLATLDEAWPGAGTLEALLDWAIAEAGAA